LDTLFSFFLLFLAAMGTHFLYCVGRVRFSAGYSG
jgi:hypothetical protein